MKSSVKDLLWMCVVMFYTLILDVGYVFSLLHFFKYGKDWLATLMFCLVFTVLTGIWNFVSIRGLMDFIKSRKNSK